DIVRLRKPREFRAQVPKKGLSSTVTARRERGKGTPLAAAGCLHPGGPYQVAQRQRNLLPTGGRAKARLEHLLCIASHRGIAYRQERLIGPQTMGKVGRS